MRNFGGINFNNTNRLHFLLVIRIHLTLLKNLIYSKVQVVRIMVKHPPHKFPIYLMCCQNQVLDYYTTTSIKQITNIKL